MITEKEEWFILHDGSILIRSEEGIFFHMVNEESFPMLISEYEGKVMLLLFHIWKPWQELVKRIAVRWNDGWMMFHTWRAGKWFFRVHRAKPGSFDYHRSQEKFNHHMDRKKILTGRGM